MNAQAKGICQYAVVLITGVLLLEMKQLPAQAYQWEVDRHQAQRQLNQQELDSVLTHMNKKWEIKVVFGRWFFASGIRSSKDELFFLPNQMNVWYIGGAWHMSERLGLELSVGIQIERNEPAAPDIISVINGGDIELEGSGAFLFPVELGLNYYFTEQRLRPFVGARVGTLVASARYIVAEGSLNNGISRTDFETTGRVGVAGLRTGIDYRLGQHVNATIQVSYQVSGPFAEPIGGYLNYQGLSLGGGLSIVL